MKLEESVPKKAASREQGAAEDARAGRGAAHRGVRRPRRGPRRRAVARAGRRGEGPRYEMTQICMPGSRFPHFHWQLGRGGSGGKLVTIALPESVGFEAASCIHFEFCVSFRRTRSKPEILLRDSR